jgi:hypothetical protein
MKKCGKGRRKCKKKEAMGDIDGKIKKAKK